MRGFAEGCASKRTNNPEYLAIAGVTVPVQFPPATANAGFCQECVKKVVLVSLRLLCICLLTCRFPVPCP